MELSELSHEEKLALVALIEVVVGSDAEVYDDEESQIDRIAATIGDDAYRALAVEADERFADEAALKTFLASLERAEARELIYGTVLEAALPEGVDNHESTLLDWLAATWNVTVRIES